MIRKSTDHDLDNIMELWLASNTEAHAFVDPSYWSTHYEEVKDAISRGVTVYEEDGNVYGFIGAVDNYIAGLFVKQDQRGCGIGTALLEDAKLNANSLCLHVFLQNEDAIRFYEKHGFRKVRLQRNEECHAMEYTMEWKS